MSICPLPDGEFCIFLCSCVDNCFFTILLSNLFGDWIPIYKAKYISELKFKSNYDFERRMTYDDLCMPCLLRWDLQVQ